jgi:hypothetical protein
MKKISRLIMVAGLIGAFSVGLTACGDSGGDSQKSGSSSSATQTKTPEATKEKSVTPTGVSEDKTVKPSSTTPESGS